MHHIIFEQANIILYTLYIYFTYYSHICFYTCIMHSNNEVKPLYPHYIHYIHMLTRITYIYIPNAYYTYHIHRYHMIYALRIELQVRRVHLLVCHMHPHILHKPNMYYLCIYMQLE